MDVSGKLSVLNMSEISSGLVAVAEVGSGFSIRWTEPDYGGSCKPYDMLVRLSDAEAIIAQKDAEILEQCRINGMGAEREATLLGKVERQSAALKLARQVLISVKETSSSTRLRRIVNEPLAAINEVLGE